MRSLESEQVAVFCDPHLPSLERIMAEKRPTIIHLHWTTPAPEKPLELARWLRYYFRLIRLRRHAAFVITAHNLLPHESTRPLLDLWLNRQLTRRADQIICHSDAARSEVVSKLDPKSSGRTPVIPHGHYIDSYPNTITPADARRRLGLEEDAVVFLLFGMIRLYKGPLDFIEAFKRIPLAKARLLIAGRPKPSDTEARVREAVMGDKRIVLVPDFIHDDDIQLYMNASDVAVFPYKKSLTSGALILAMSFGKACIAPRLPSTVELVDAQGGFIYDPDSPGGLQNAATEALARKDCLQSMGRHNLEQVKHFDWEMIGRQTKQCYLRALASLAERRPKR